MARILVSGSTAWDVLLGHDGSFTDSLRPDSLENLSVAFLAPHHSKHHGGTGANIAWNLKILSQDPLLVSSVGSDGGPYTALLEERGISTRYVQTLEDHATSLAIVATDSEERQITFYHPGADAHASWPELADERETIAHAIISPRDAHLMMKGAQWCASQKIPFLFDPGQQIMSLSDDELARAVEMSSGVVVNAYEWSLMKERLGCTEENIALLTPLLIVTQGESGLVLYSAEETCSVQACKATSVINPTGAGDAFRAGLLAGLGSKWPLLHAARLGACMGSFAVEQEGTLIDMFDKEEAWERMRQTYGEEMPVLT